MPIHLHGSRRGRDTACSLGGPGNLARETDRRKGVFGRRFGAGMARGALERHAGRSVMEDRGGRTERRKGADAGQLKILSAPL